MLLLFKGLNSEIRGRRETLDSLLKDNEACVNSVKVKKLIKIINYYDLI